MVDDAEAEIPLEEKAIEYYLGGPMVEMMDRVFKWVPRVACIVTAPYLVLITIAGYPASHLVMLSVLMLSLIMVGRMFPSRYAAVTLTQAGLQGRAPWRFGHQDRDTTIALDLIDRAKSIRESGRCRRRGFFEVWSRDGRCVMIPFQMMKQQDVEDLLGRIGLPLRVE